MDGTLYVLDIRCLGHDKSYFAREQKLVMIAEIKDFVHALRTKQNHNNSRQ